MPLNWLDTSNLSFNHMLLLEQVQISWLPNWGIDSDLALALSANPVVAWYFRHKCPQVAPWLDRLEAEAHQTADRQQVYTAEQRVMQAVNDLMVYAIEPAIYDALPFLGWNSHELTGLVDFCGKTVIDVGSGTGRLAFVAAPMAAAVYCVEPVGNLRNYLRAKARQRSWDNVFPVDGTITAIPFPDHFADIVMSGHVFGDQPVAEITEMERVTRPGGMVILCPGNNDQDNEAHAVLAADSYNCSRFEQPVDGWKRKYWKLLPTV